MIKKELIDPNYKPNHADMKECLEIMKTLDEALESHPIDFEKINKVLYTITSATFKYPNVQKCNKKCLAPERNELWREAINILKTMEGVNNYDDLMEIYELSRLNLFGYGDA